jgi:cytochrome c-type biogenesis protein CcmH
MWTRNEHGRTAPSPACGGGLGRGNSTARTRGKNPLPNPPPRAGEGIAPTRRLRPWWGCVLVGLVLSAMQPAVAVQPDEILKDSGLEARARALSRELRCMVCQNQSIDDSDAPLARDLRVLVRERLTTGDSDSQVIDFLVARYGEFVLLKPRFAWHNAVLWLTPAAALLAGGIAMFVAMRRRRKVPLAATPLSPDEERRLAEVIDPAL